MAEPVLSALNQARALPWIGKVGRDGQHVIGVLPEQNSGEPSRLRCGHHDAVSAGEQLAGASASGIRIRMRDQHDALFFHGHGSRKGAGTEIWLWVACAFAPKTRAADEFRPRNGSEPLETDEFTPYAGKEAVT